MVGGAFAYRLYKGGVSTPVDGDWYLRSALIDDPSDPLYQPGVPLYEAYAGSLQAFNKLGTLQQRVGNRSWLGRTAGVVETGNDDANGVWARVEATHAEFEPSRSTSGIDYDAAIWRMQAGVDGLLAESEAGRLVAGASVHYGVVSSSVTSVHGNGSIGSNSIGLGGTLTWYDRSGFYLDGLGVEFAARLGVRALFMVRDRDDWKEVPVGGFAGPRRHLTWVGDGVRLLPRAQRQLRG